MPLLIRNARVLTLARGPRPRRGPAMDALARVDKTDILVGREVIAAVGHSLSMPPGVRVIEAGGRIVMPAFVDCHTHACFVGDRLDEWSMLRAGATYQQIASGAGSSAPAGGGGGPARAGIWSTVRAVRAAPRAALADALAARLDVMLREGTTTVEVKSGYGLSTDDEIKMLHAIADASSDWPGTVVPSALIGHAVDPDDPNFVRRTIAETLPAVSREFPGIAVDLYCERSAWSVEDSIALIDRAREAGHPVRVHVDQFNSLGLLPQAILRGCRSVDHLEASTPEDLRRLGASGTIGVLLPCSGFHLSLGRRGRAASAPDFANARAIIDAEPAGGGGGGPGGAIAIATNFNPGSSPCSSMPFAVSLGVRALGLSPAEAIVASTVNAAEVLALPDRGAIAPGQRADLLVLRHRDERELAHEFGGNPVDVVVCGGEVVRGSTPAFR